MKGALVKSLRRSRSRNAHRWAATGAGLLCMPMALQAAGAVVEPGARLAYGGLMIDGLQRRLGEIRYIMPTDAWGGEAFVRHAGASFDGGVAGRHAHVRASAAQLGASVAYWNEEGASHRMGWALDRGTLRARPGGRTAQATVDMKGLSAWYTHQRDSGAYMDAVLGRARPAGGNASAARGSQWAVSVEAGAPLPLGEKLALEPQVQLKHQALRVGAIRARQTGARLGLRLAGIDNERFVPYAQVDLEQQLGRTDRNSAVRHGTVVRLSTGMTIKVHRVVDIYADAGVQRRLAGAGGSGGSFQAAIRINI